MNWYEIEGITIASVWVTVALLLGGAWVGLFHWLGRTEARRQAIVRRRYPQHRISLPSGRDITQRPIPGDGTGSEDDPGRHWAL